MYISYLYICATALLLWEVCAFGGLEAMTSRSLTRLRRRTARIRLNMGVSWDFSGCVDVRLILISHNMNNNVAKCHWCFVFKARLFTQYVVSKDGMHKKATKWTLRSKNFMIIIYKRKKIKRWKLLHFVQEVDRIPPSPPLEKANKQKTQALGLDLTLSEEHSLHANDRTKIKLRHTESSLYIIICYCWRLPKYFHVRQQESE